jgi:hypothetical protein
LKGNLVLSQCAVAMELLSYQQICGQIAEQIVLVTSFCILFQCTGLLKKHLAYVYMITYVHVMISKNIGIGNSKWLFRSVRNSIPCMPCNVSCPENFGQVCCVSFRHCNLDRCFCSLHVASQVGASSNVRHIPENTCVQCFRVVAIASQRGNL